MHIAEIPRRTKDTANAIVEGIKNNPAVKGLQRFAKLERILATTLLFTPIFLILFDPSPDYSSCRVEECNGCWHRDSISAYFCMKENQIFYFLLTVAAMMFIVNGVVKTKRHYNTFLGIMLSGVILFDHLGEYSKYLHYFFAVVFFVGNGVVMLVYSKKMTKRWKVYLAIIMIISFMLWKPLGWISLFTAEWISLIMITIHYLEDIEPGKLFVSSFNYMKNMMSPTNSVDN